MANQLFANPYPYGTELNQRYQHVHGTVALAGSAVSAGEPINWGSILTGIGFNEKNFAGNGVVGNATALTTGFAISSGVCTVTAANNFSAGQQVTFVGNTGTLSEAFNGVTVTVVTAGSTSFTFDTAVTGTTTTGDKGLAFSGSPFYPLSLPRQSQTASVTSLAVSGGIITATAANSFLPGASVTFAGLSTTLGLLMNGVTFTVAQSTGTTFTMPSQGLTGSAGSDTGTATGNNVGVPFKARFWSKNESGYLYQYQESTGNLFVLETASLTPSLSIGAGTPATYPVGTAANSGSTTLVATAAVTVPLTATTAAALGKLAAAAYPAGVLSDVIAFEALFAKDR